MATIQLQVVSPERLVCDKEIAMLIVRSTGGELGILPRHAPLVTGLIPHAMRIKLDGQEEQLMAVAGGLMEVTPKKITVLVSAAEEPEQIDVNRAQAAYARAKQRIEAFKQAPTQHEDIDIDRAEAALARAKARLIATRTSFN
ncbi:MAG: ATP synthase F1 subunit epsilon [Selenomonadaceae bacterium]|nr:ATP synthase F1 subunit epsilon [Selenomonadaceae bacterium]